MRCERDWGRRYGVPIRCTRTGSHSVVECEPESSTEVAKKILRIALYDNSAEIKILWDGDKIAGVTYNGRPIGPEEWRFCGMTELPLVPWDGPPKQAWLIYIGNMFRCSDCNLVVPSSQGAEEVCDSCWSKRADYWKIVGILMKATAEAISEKPGASAEDTARMAGEILALRPASVDDSASEEDCHAATLSAHCGCRPWEEMAELSKRIWIERAKRLRKRWAVDELQLNSDTGDYGNVALREACSQEPEWDNKALTLQQAAAAALRRLRIERDVASCQRDLAIGNAEEWRKKVIACRARLDLLTDAALEAALEKVK